METHTYHDERPIELHIHIDGQSCIDQGVELAFGILASFVRFVGVMMYIIFVLAATVTTWVWIELPDSIALFLGVALGYAALPFVIVYALRFCFRL